MVVCLGLTSVLIIFLMSSLIETREALRPTYAGCYHVLQHDLLICRH